MLRTVQAPPKRGSLQEWALVLTLERLEDVEHARFRALAQIYVDKDAGIKAFEDYMKIAFPSQEAKKRESKEAIKSQLMSWVKQGPFKVTPYGTDTVKSKLKTKVMATRASKDQQKRHTRLSKKWEKKA